MQTITSVDGSRIAYERSGSGAPLVLVHGTTADHSRWEPVRPALAEHFTVYAMDRRGRGESGDSDTYSLDLEVEDVVALVDSIDEPVTLLGHSFGALVSMEAALRTENVRQLVLYEPAFAVGDRELDPDGVIDEVERLLAAGDDEGALVVFFEDLVQLPPAQLAAIRAAPNWPDRVAAAHTVLREERAEEAYRLDPDRFTALEVPTVLLSGTESAQLLRDATTAVAAAVPNSRIVELEGEGHVAQTTAPDLFVEAVLDAVRERPAGVDE